METTTDTASVPSTTSRLSLRETAGAYGAALLLAVLTLLPGAVGLSAGRPVPYGNDSHCDPWYYFGLILFPDWGTTFLNPSDRQSARALFFAPIHVLKFLLPGLDVNVLVFLFFVPIALAALYVALRAMFGRISSAAAVLLIGTSPLFIDTSSVTYVTVGSAAYGTAMLAAMMWAGRLTQAKVGASDALFLLAGVFFVFAANANLMAVEFNALYVLFAIPVHLLTNERVSYRPAVAAIARAAGLFLVGAVVGIALTLLVSHAIGAGLRAPYNQIAAALQGVGEWQYEGWLAETSAFALISLMTVLCVFALARVHGRVDVGVWRLRLVVAVVLGTSAVTLWLSLSNGDQNLTYDYFYFLLLPCVALAFCAAFAARIEQAGIASLTSLAVTVLALNLLLTTSTDLRQLLNGRTQIAAYPIVATLALFLWAGWRRSGTWRTSVIVAMAVAALQAANGRHFRLDHNSSLAEARATARTTEAALTFIHENVPVRPVVWIAKGDGNRLALPIFRSMTRCGFQPSFPDALPDPDLHWQPALAAGQTLILLDREATRLGSIQEALAPHRLMLELKAARYFGQADGKGGGVQITIGHLADTPSPSL